MVPMKTAILSLGISENYKHYTAHLHLEPSPDKHINGQAKGQCWVMSWSADHVAQNRFTTLGTANQ